jgi:hypothetical protein
MTKPTQEPTDLQKHMGRYPLYVRIGFAMVVVFGMVGNCAGRREQSMFVFILVSIIWVCSRIITEAIDAYRVLVTARAHDAKKKDEPPTGT